RRSIAARRFSFSTSRPPCSRRPRSQLWQVLRGMRDRGETIVLITHKLDEVMDISDTITVMRHGRTVERLRTADTTPAAIARAMVGRDVQLLVAVDGVSFTLSAGEILGIAGVEGNGQTELIEAIAGLRAVESGSIRLAGRDATGQPVRARGDAGLSHIPEDRHLRGLILDYSVAENLILGQQHRYVRGARLDDERIAANARRQIETYDIRPADPALPARALSGGNQQKVVVAREMGRDFHTLLAAQPTRGVDVGAIEFIHARLRAARDAGKAILLVSADLAEVLALSDRIAVMYGGKIVVVLPRANASAEILGPYMTGAAAHRAA